ncbi:hypothetical protein DAT35_29940 [Vitiosangium sp. GDMCC 1.1324]|nr:hypothetical protein DAT35_29940 [Vitiosangium sp. GDMCC 1.1324]
MLFQASLHFNAFRILGKGHTEAYDAYSFDLMRKTIEEQASRPLLYPLVFGPGTPYFSQLGLHGRSLYWLYRALGSPAPETFYASVNFVLALLMALLLSAFFLEARKRFGTWPVAIAAGLTALSPYLVALASETYWVMFLSFTPFVAAFCLYPRVQRGELARWKFLAVLGLSVLVKSLCGYEFTSTVLLAPCVAILFHETTETLQPRRLVKLLVLPSVAMIAGFATAMVLHLTQIYVLHGEEGLQGLRSSAELRTGGSGYNNLTMQVVAPEVLSQMRLQRELLANQTGVELPDRLFTKATEGYRRVVFFRLLSHLWLPAFALPGVRLGMPTDAPRASIAMGTVMAALLAAAAFTRRRRNPGEQVLFHVSALSLLAFLAPFSWLILAKGHMVFHPFINGILFHVPALLLGNLALGLLLARAMPAVFSAYAVAARVVGGRWQAPEGTVEANRRGLARGHLLLAATVLGLAWAVYPPTSRLITPSSLTDENWENGIHRLQAGFFVEDQSRLASIRTGATLTFAGSGMRKLSKLDGRDVWVEGPVLDPATDGAPNFVRVEFGWSQNRQNRWVGAIALGSIGIGLLLLGLFRTVLRAGRRPTPATEGSAPANGS